MKKSKWGAYRTDETVIEEKKIVKEEKKFVESQERSVNRLRGRKWNDGQWKTAMKKKERNQRKESAC